MGIRTEIPASVEDLARKLGEPRRMRRGTLSERYQRCNKPGCVCGKDRGARHGPYYSVVRVVAGQTRSRHVPSSQADLLRQQVEAGQQFRKLVEAYWEACEQWADAQLDEAHATSSAVAQKGGSTRRSTRKSSRRSNHESVRKRWKASTLKRLKQPLGVAGSRWRRVRSRNVSTSS